MSISKITYKDQVIDFLYDTIIKGKLNPGDRVSEIWLVEKLKISRAPIREALRQLSREGLIEYKPQIGNYVSALSSKQIFDTYVTRGVLEGFAASAASESFEESDFVKLEKLIAKMVDSAKQHQDMNLSNFDKQFHEYIFRKSNNFQLIEFAKILSVLLHVIFCKYWTKVYKPEQIESRHKFIVDSIRQKDKQLIEACIRRHYEETGKYMSQFGSDIKEN